MKNLKKTLLQGLNYINEAEEPDLDTEEEMDTEAPEAAPTPDPETTIQTALQTALKAAKELGDEKLIDQIGNTYTFFTREYIVGSEDSKPTPSVPGNDINLEEDTDMMKDEDSSDLGNDNLEEKLSSVEQEWDVLSDEEHMELLDSIDNNAENGYAEKYVGSPWEFLPEEVQNLIDAQMGGVKEAPLNESREFDLKGYMKKTNLFEYSSPLTKNSKQKL